MNKKLLLILCVLLFFVSGCDKEKQVGGIKVISVEGEYIILENGERICSVEETNVYFENKTGYVVINKYGHDIYYELNETYNYNNRIIFYPEIYLEVCSDIGDDDINNLCINQLYNLTLPCSYCITITYNQTIIDEGRNCLSEMEKEVLEWMGR